MCGVIGMTLDASGKAKEKVKVAYEKQKSRGHEGFGYGMETDGHIFRERYTDEKDIFLSDWLFAPVTGYLMFHNRQPTSTPNLIPCNHPFMSEDGTVLLIHNGILSESQAAKTLKQKHVFDSQITLKWESAGKTICSEKGVTDSEYALHFYEEAKAKHGYKKALKDMAEESALSGTFLIMDKSVDGILFVSIGGALESTDYDGTLVLNSMGHTLEDTYGVLRHNKVKILGRIEKIAWGGMGGLGDLSGHGKEIDDYYDMAYDPAAWSYCLAAESKIQAPESYNFYLESPTFDARDEDEARKQLANWLKTTEAAADAEVFDPLVQDRF